jgi:hypothetical protein
MNTELFHICCEVCGGTDLGSAQVFRFQWTGGFVSHKDPRICADILKKKEEEKKNYLELFRLELSKPSKLDEAINS